MLPCGLPLGLLWGVLGSLEMRLLCGARMLCGGMVIVLADNPLVETVFDWFVVWN